MAGQPRQDSKRPGLEWRMQSFGRIGGLGLGTVAFRMARRDRAFAVLDAWRTAGGRLIDTAAVYGHGESESVIGAWLRQRTRQASPNKTISAKTNGSLGSRGSDA